jgi:rSAM/selenodomain-associated transferase 1
MDDKTVILIFAKAPVPGEVKTRLIPACGAEQAALLHAALTERAIETAAAAGYDVVLCGAPDTTHAFFETCAEDFDITLADQLPNATLGERMKSALDDALAEWPRVLLIGADCPALTPRLLKQAAAALSAHDVVLIPAEDGGYVLIGARRTAPDMFASIEWGTAQVLTQQRAALTRAGLSWMEFEPLWDVDLPGDLARLAALKPPLAFSLDV